MYRPFPQDFNSCPDFSEAEKVSYQNTRMYVKAKPGEPVVVLYHGNAGSACDRAFYADLFSDFGYGYVVVEYAGYSNDTRAPSHELVKQDAAHVVDYLEHKGLQSVIVVGESIGTGPAAYHASIAPPERILLISPFTNLAAVAQSRFWFYPTSIMVDNAFDNVSALGAYEGEVTIIHGSNDAIIPLQLGDQLFRSLQTTKKFVSVKNAGHNDLFQYEATHNAVREFLLR